MILEAAMKDYKGKSQQSYSHDTCESHSLQNFVIALRIQQRHAWYWMLPRASKAMDLGEELKMTTLLSKFND